MERRKALVVAGTMTATLAMAGGALAANMGLLQRADAEVGKLDASTVSQLEGSTTTTTEPEPEVTIIVQDVPVGGGAASAPAGAGSAPGGSSGYSGAPAAPAPGSRPGPRRAGRRFRRLRR